MRWSYGSIVLIFLAGLIWPVWTLAAGPTQLSRLRDAVAGVERIEQLLGASEDEETAAVAVGDGCAVVAMQTASSLIAQQLKRALSQLDAAMAAAKRRDTVAVGGHYLEIIKALRRSDTAFELHVLGGARCPLRANGHTVVIAERDEDLGWLSAFDPTKFLIRGAAADHRPWLPAGIRPRNFLR